jgi:acyl dehydratase
MPAATKEGRAGPVNLSVGDRFSKHFAFSKDSIRRFAALVGDTNPLHHDEAAAGGAPFGTIVASGTQSMAMMLAVVPDHFKDHGLNLGLEASVRMLRPIRAGDGAHAEWEIVEITNTPKLKGWIVTANGRLVREDGVVVMTAMSKTLIYWPRKNA